MTLPPALTKSRFFVRFRGLLVSELLPILAWCDALDEIFAGLWGLAHSISTGSCRFANKCRTDDPIE